MMAKHKQNYAVQTQRLHAPTKKKKSVACKYMSKVMFSTQTYNIWLTSFKRTHVLLTNRFGCTKKKRKTNQFAAYRFRSLSTQKPSHVTAVPIGRLRAQPFRGSILFSDSLKVRCHN